jgi:hypothetical protein
MFYVGLDLGKRLDYSAVAVVERGEEARFDYLHWMQQSARKGLVVRFLERIRLGTPYTEVVERVVKIIEQLRDRHVKGGRRQLVVDATGVGMPVVDMLRAAEPDCELTPVLITSGAEQHLTNGVWHVPKVDLLAGVQAALETGELRIARRMRETQTLVQEMMDVRVKLRGSGGMRLGADGFGQHDDLVLAVALACWAARRGTVGEKSEPFRLQ